MADVPVRIQLVAQGIGTCKEIKVNVRRSAKYPRVEWGVLKYPMCAVVGGGLSVRTKLDMLRKWEGDIFAINDTAGFLSDNGISSIIYAVDPTKVPFKIGANVRGACFASRVHRKQFTQMKDKPIFVFDMAEEDNMTGIEGGPTAVCRTPHLMLRMGYRGITYFGIDGSLTPKATHTSGYSKAAYDNMIIITAGGVGYYTNAGFMLQNEYMAKTITKYHQFLVNGSDGLIKAMLENPDTWSVTAVAEDLKKKYEDKGCMVWSKEYRGGNNIWLPA